MQKFTFMPTPLLGLHVIKPTVLGDDRGYFMETYNQNDFFPYITDTFVQDNQSKSAKGVLRGLHFQAKNPQSKLVRVLYGEVFDVAVDMRKCSKTYGHHFAIKLSQSNNLQFYIPKGFAHGFLVLSDYAIFAYKCNQFYDPSSEYSLLYNDSQLGINWPINKVPTLILSEKDKCAKPLSYFETMELKYLADETGSSPTCPISK